MKKIIRIILWSILSILLLAYIGLFILYNTYQPGKIDQAIAENNLSYYYSEYDDCRAAFLSLCSELETEFHDVALSHIPVPGEGTDPINVDLAYIPAQDTSLNLLILNSGIHGVEGFAGSAIQLMTIRELLSPEILSRTGILFIHGLNPYGFKYGRRVSGNNIDLNRNCAINPHLYQGINKGYGNLFDMLNPEAPANQNSFRNLNFHLIAVQKILAESMPVLRQAVLQGQYEYENGLYFGGTQLEPQIHSLENLLGDLMREYKCVVTIDLHTGYGENGKMHLFPNPIEDQKVKAGLEKLFEGYQIDWGDSDDFYTILGSYVDWIGSLAKVESYYPMVLEYGTLDSQKTFGSIRSLQNMILENEGFHYGYKTDKAKKKINENFHEMYYPSNNAWRSKVMEDSRTIIRLVLERLNNK